MEFLCVGDMPILHLFINHLFISVLTQGHLFYTLGYNQIHSLPVLFLIINYIPASGPGSASIWRLYLWHPHNCSFFFFKVFSHFLISQRVPGFSYIFCPRFYPVYLFVLDIDTFRFGSSVWVSLEFPYSWTCFTYL